MFFDLSKAKSILCIGAHPDDIEIGCGGTVLALLDSNPDLKLDWVVFGCNQLRKAEAQAAFEAWTNRRANCVPHFYDFEDTLFPSQIVEIKRAMHKLSESIHPDVIFTHRREDYHQDHRTLAEVTWNTFRGHLILEYEIAKYEGDLGNPNVFVSLTDEIALKKTEMLMNLFPTQQTKPWYNSGAFQSIMRLRGIEAKSASGFAEAFHGRKIWLQP